MPNNHFVADTTALTAIEASSVRVEGYPKLVLSPGNNESSAWYIYRQFSTASALGNIILIPDDAPSTGRWLKQSNLYHYASAAPSSTPPLRGVTWIASLSSPTRKVIYLSLGTSSSADWTPFGNGVIPSSGSPSFTPDYVGQQYYDTSGELLYVAEGISSSSDWVAISSGSGGS